MVKWKYNVAKNVSKRIIFSALRPLNILRTPLAPFQQLQIISYHVHIMSIWADFHVWLPLVNLTLLPNTQQSVECMSVAVEEKQTLLWWFECDCGHWKRKEKEHDAFPFSAFTYFLLSSTGSLTSFCILHRRQINSFKKQLTGWKPVTVIICQRGGELACQTWIVRIKCFFW